MSGVSKSIGVMDIGETAIRCGVFEYKFDDEIIVLKALEIVENSAIEKGEFLDLQLLSELIKRAIESAEKNSGVDLDSLYVSIGGKYINVVALSQDIDVLAPQSGVSDADLKNLMGLVQGVNVPYDKKMIDIVVNRYRVDALNRLSNPIGVLGSKLYMDYLMIIGDQVIVSNYNKIFNDYIGIKVDKYVISPLSLGESIITKNEKDEGVIIIDIGHNTTSVSVFYKGVLLFLKFFSFGGRYFVNDLMQVLKINNREAKRVLDEFNEGFQTEIFGDKLEITQIDGKKVVVKLVNIAKILEARIRDMFENKVLPALNKDRIFDREDIEIGAGIVLSGGGGKLKILPLVLEHIFNKNVKLGTITNIEGDKQAVNDPSNNVVFGLMKYAINDLKKSDTLISVEKNSSKDSEIGVSSVIKRIKNFIIEYL